VVLAGECENAVPRVRRQSERDVTLEADPDLIISSKSMAAEVAATAASWRAGLLSGKTGLWQFFGPKRLALLVMFVASIAWVWHYHRQGLLGPEQLRHDIAARPLMTTVVFLGLYAGSICAMLPTLPFNLAAGVFWGPFGGGLVAAAGAWAGAMISFLAARIMFGPRLAQRFGPRILRWLQQELERSSWRFVAFLRLNPAIPTGPLNYVLGLTGISFWAYCWATFIFLVPPSIAIAWIGSAIGGFVIDAQVGRAIRMILLVSAAVTVLVALRWAGRYRAQKESITPRAEGG
jgi:uncharacterized membrane protein YdjX (TVP38/TMEM64 family)